jgi:hypothetical protein
MAVNQTGNQLILPAINDPGDPRNLQAIQRWANTQVVNRITNAEASTPILGQQGTGLVEAPTGSGLPTLMTAGAEYDAYYPGYGTVLMLPFVTVSHVIGFDTGETQYPTFAGMMTNNYVTVPEGGAVWTNNGYSFQPSDNIFSGFSAYVAGGFATSLGGYMGIYVQVNNVANTEQLLVGWPLGDACQEIAPNFYYGPDTPGTVLARTGSDLALATSNPYGQITTDAGGIYSFVYLFFIYVPGLVN